jgi:predicted FMN-binding regulatory protein PaiB
MIIQQSLLSVTVEVQRSIESAWHEKNHKTVPTLLCPVIHLQGMVDRHLTLNMVAVGTFQTMTHSHHQKTGYIFSTTQVNSYLV